MLQNIAPVFAALVLAINLGAQQVEDPRTTLRNMGALEATGDVPVIYSPSAEQRALAYQKSLRAAHTWLQKELHVQVPVTLAVLDKKMWEKVSEHQPLPHADTRSGLIYVPANWGGESSGGQRLPGERILFHEVGHMFAAPLKLYSSNGFINELIANVFLAAYIRTERPDQISALDGPPADRPFPLYATLADLIYLAGAYQRPSADYGWIQAHSQRLAGILLGDQKLLDVIHQFQAALPADWASQKTAEQIISRLEGVRPDVRKILGPFGAPSTITRTTPSACRESTKKDSSSGSGPLVVQNDTDAPLILTIPEGRRIQFWPPGNANAIPAHSWRRYYARAGDEVLLKLADGGCLVAGVEPTLAIIEKP
jgi:hypothetical protein